MAKAGTKTQRLTVVGDKEHPGTSANHAAGSASKAMLREAKAIRQTNPREAHRTIGEFPSTRDPVGLILASNEDRVAALVPVRHTRMLESPFTFYRGTAALQAHDLSYSPASGISVQCCGDAHLMNFGGFATPERQLIFDLNDFDETYPAPFEWDLKRLVPSMVLAARWRGFSESDAHDIAETTARAYRERILASADDATLDTWYSAVTWKEIRDQVAGINKVAREVDHIVSKAQDRTAENVFHKLTTSQDGEPRLLDQPPLLYHPPDIDMRAVAGSFLDGYAKTLRDDYGNLFSRLRFVDAALKVVGVGSVGTRCFVALLLGEQQEPVFLQIKEARDSVLASHGKKSAKIHNGERVVSGQRLMQAASDIFLGWARGQNQRDYYVRQLRDMKMSVDLAKMGSRGLTIYGILCGQTLARAHAKAGAAARIAGYLGKSDTFDKAMRRYATSYADQAEKDYEAFRRAVGTGRVHTETGLDETKLMIS
jgi:uncharacterized protein (DUF2252 family)